MQERGWRGGGKYSFHAGSADDSNPAWAFLRFTVPRFLRGAAIIAESTLSRQAVGKGNLASRARQVCLSRMPSLYQETTRHEML
jgi:hypothetical protein